MGTALYLEFENEIPGYDPRASVLGEPLSRVIQFGKGQVDLICHSDGLTQIYEFYSESNEEAFAKIGEPVPPGLKPDPIKWTAPEEGLRAIDAVLACSENLRQPSRSRRGRRLARLVLALERNPVDRRL